MTRAEVRKLFDTWRDKTINQSVVLIDAYEAGFLAGRNASAEAVVNAYENINGRKDVSEFLKDTIQALGEGE